MQIVCAHCGNNTFRLSRSGEDVLAECLRCGLASPVQAMRKPAINVIHLVLPDRGRGGSMG